MRVMFMGKFIEKITQEHVDTVECRSTEHHPCTKYLMVTEGLLASRSIGGRLLVTVTMRLHNQAHQDAPCIALVQVAKSGHQLVAIASRATEGLRT